LVQAFLKKWWVESDFKAPNLPLSLRFKVSGFSSHLRSKIKDLLARNQNDVSEFSDMSTQGLLFH